MLAATIDTMRTLILLTAILTYATNNFGQGFYDNNYLLINKKVISNLNISSVTSTTYTLDSSFHPLSNFVFEYKFDSIGNINHRKYWNTSLSDNKYSEITLIVDTGYFVPQFQRFSYACVAQSQVVKFDQSKRTKQYFKKVYKQFNELQRPNKNCWIKGMEESNFLADTTLLSKQVSIPRWLIPTGDSLAFVTDTLITFRKSGKSLHLSSKCYVTENNALQIDWMYDVDTNDVGTYKIWRSYYINSLGLVYRETHNIFTTMYFYNPERLHIRTETFQDGSRTGRTTFTYKFGSR